MKPDIYEISKEQALEITKTHNGGQEPIVYKVSDIAPETFYNPPKENCWYIFCDWDPPRKDLHSCRLIVVSKITGNVLCDIDARDEG